MSQQQTNDTSTPTLLITVWEAGRQLGMAPGTIKKRIEQGNFPIQVRKLGRNLMCCRADVPLFVEKFFDKVPSPANDPTINSGGKTESQQTKRGPGRPRKGA